MSMRTFQQLADLKGRRALVTGGGGYIGYAIGEALAELGAEVALLDVDRKRSEDAAARLQSSFPGKAQGVACDLGDDQATRAMVRSLLNRWGGLEILVHSAAFVGTSGMEGWAVPFDQQTVEAWDRGLRVNLTSAFVLAQEAREALAVSGKGSIVLIGSISGMTGPEPRLYEGTKMTRVAAYAASKGGLIQLTRYLATLFAPRVRVNCMSPGGIERGQAEIFRAKYCERTPLGRMGTEEDMKGAAAFLASDLSAYITGQNLAVDGGWTAW